MRGQIHSVLLVPRSPPAKSKSASPAPATGSHVWAVRTADGRYAKIELVSYYCPHSQPGCLTFRYVYQGDGTRVVSGKPS